MEPERDRMKHLLIILLEALGGSPGEGPVNHRRIQEKITAAGLDEQDVAGLLDWIESSWNRDEAVQWTLTAVGGAALLTGAVLLIALGAEVRVGGDDEARVLPLLGPEYAGVALELRR